MTVVRPARLLTTRADAAAVVVARASAADRADAVRTVFATALLAYGTDARDSVISAELVFTSHTNILVWRFSAEVCIRIERGFHDSGCGVIR